ncbi:MAG: long-chain fatty acid--CoA ligase [Anaerolineae bacterium]|nr:long-chain fatty acid--CoA ligase [Anaerolineae bacterium]
MPHAQVVTIPTSAHLAQLERPDAVNRAISRFIGARSVSWREFSRPSNGASRPWTRFYDVGVPVEVRPPVQPLDRFLTSAARRQPHRAATVFYGQTLTYRELDQAANRLANALLGQGIGRGDRVLVYLPNCPQAVIAFYGILKAGAVTVMASPLATADELAYLLRDSGAVHAICLKPYLPRVAQAAPGTDLRRITTTTVTDYAPWDLSLLWRLRRQRDEQGTQGSPASRSLLVDDFKTLLRVAPDLAPDLAVQPDDLACLHYTSGTTGEPKGVMLTHANLVANTVQARSWLPDVRYSGEVYLTVLPLWHSYGAMSAMSVPVSLAATMVILPRFDVAETLRAVQAYKPTIFPGVPSMYVAIKDYPDVRKYGIASIRACLSGAAPLPVEVQEAFEKLTRGRLVEGYGLTEAGPVTHVNPLGGRRRIGSIGLPLPSTDARIVDLATGLDLPPGSIGELCVRGPQVMVGYWNRPAETMAALRDGWLHTGDVARMDEDGFFQIVERKADLWPGVFAPDGAVIFPRDIEEVLYEHPKVQEAAVAAVEADGQSSLKAFVVLRRGEHATPGEILDYARQRLPGEAIPRAVEFVKDLPKSPIGKVIRRLLVNRDEGQQREPS